MAKPDTSFDAQIVDLYGQQLSIDAITRHVPGSYKFVRDRLLANNVKLRPRGGNRKPRVSHAEMLKTKRLYLEDKQSLSQVAAATGVNRTTVIRRLDQMGVKRRPANGR